MTSSLPSHTLCLRARWRAFIVPWAAVYVGLLALHLGIGYISRRLPAHDLSTPLDRLIPLVPSFAWIYASYWLFPILPLFAIRDPTRFRLTLLAAIVASTTASVAFLLLPVSIPKPELGSSVSERLLASIYAADAPASANCFPSLHVALAFLVARGCAGQGLPRALERALYAHVFLISLSTLFVRQHVLVDVVLGYLWAMGAWGVAGAWWPWLRKRRRSGTCLHTDQTSPHCFEDVDKHIPTPTPISWFGHRQ